MTTPPDNLYANLPELLGANGQVILPPSGLVCPECGFEPSRLPDGRPSDSISFTIKGVTTPHYHFGCAQAALIKRDAEYVASCMRPLGQKEETPDGNVSPA